MVDKNYKFENLEELEEYIKRNCIVATDNGNGNKLYLVELEFAYHLEDMKNVWTEYICCEGTKRNGILYDIPSWDVGVNGLEGDIYIYCEVVSEYQ